jgi:hypothetical protein
MQQLGWSDSRNVRLDIRWGAGNPETNCKRAEEMVALAPAIIRGLRQRGCGGVAPSDPQRAGGVRGGR